MTDTSFISCKVLGKTFSLEEKSGRVIDTSQWSETHVHGGSGGHGVPVSIGSTVVDRGEIWLVDKNGKEFTWNMVNTKLGQRASHILSGVGPNDSKPFFGAYNHNLEKMEWWSSAMSNYFSISKIVQVTLIIIFGLALHSYVANLLEEPNLFDKFDGENVVFLVFEFMIAWALIAILNSIIKKLRIWMFDIKYKSRIEKYLLERTSILSSSFEE